MTLRRTVKPVRLWMVFGPDGDPLLGTVCRTKDHAESHLGQLRRIGCFRESELHLARGTWTPDKPRTRR